MGHPEECVRAESLHGLALAWGGAGFVGQSSSYDCAVSWRSRLLVVLALLCWRLLAAWAPVLVRCRLRWWAW